MSTSKDEVDAHVDKCCIMQKSLLQCKQCTYKCLFKKSFLRHVKLYHTDMSCKKCDYKTDIYKYFIKHQKSHLTGNLYTIKCDICGYETSDNLTMKVHKKKQCKLNKYVAK